MLGLSRLLGRRRRYDDLSLSIAEHIDERTGELVAEGMPPTEAAQTARREFGNVGLVQERSREVWQWPTIASVFADLRFALRQLAKSPGFTVTSVLTLALGIAVNATMFSLVSAFLLPRLPGLDPSTLYVVSSVNPYAQFLPDTNPVSAPNYLRWSGDTRIFAGMAADDAFRIGSLSGPGQQPESVSYSAVSPNYFSVFGVSPVLGRGFLAGEDRAGRNHVLILSYSIWSRRYGADPSIVGRVIRLNREDYLVAGVMPADFRLLGFTPQLWTPLTLAPDDRSPEARKHRALYLFARLGPGVTLEQARSEMNVLAQQAQHDFPEIERRWGVVVRRLPDFLIRDFNIRSALNVIMTVVGFVLLIACANVAGLLLTRAVGRQKELAIRMSLGASRRRMVRQLLTEGVVIALLGGGAGLVLAFFGIRLLRAGLNFNEAIGAVPVQLDAKVLLFAAAISLVAAILSSVAPALRASRTEINTELKNETRGATTGREQNRLRVALVGGEIALALFLLIGSCLLIRGVYLIDHQKLGFSQDHLLTARLVLDQARYAEPPQQVRFVRSLIAEAGHIPGTEGAAVASELPASGPGSVTIHLRGEPATRPGAENSALDVLVTPDYFRILGIPLLGGRLFTDPDDAPGLHAVVVNQAFARKYFGNGDPVGRQIQLDAPGAGWSQIVGMVGDVRSFSQDPRIEPEVYESYLERPVNSFALMLRSSADPGALAPDLRHAVAGIDSDLPLLQVTSMDNVIEEQRGGNPLFVRLLATFAALALILSAIGIYGLIAYSVGQRTQEIGIRLALGASGIDIARMILRDGLKVALAGSAIGLIAAIPLPKVFSAIFEGTLSFASPAIYLFVLLGMLGVAVGATFGPALRARRVSPTIALRNQ